MLAEDICFVAERVRESKWFIKGTNHVSGHCVVIPRILHESEVTINLCQCDEKLRLQACIRRILSLFECLAKQASRVFSAVPGKMPLPPLEWQRW